MALIVSFILISTLLTILARIGRKMFKKSWKDKNYVELTRSFLDSMNVATVHGIEKFPKQDSMKTLLSRYYNTTEAERSGKKIVFLYSPSISITLILCETENNYCDFAYLSYLVIQLDSC